MSRLRRDTLELWKASVPSKLIRRMRATKGENFPSCLTNLLLFLRMRAEELSLKITMQYRPWQYPAWSHKSE